MGIVVKCMKNGFYQNCRYNGVEFLKTCFVRNRRAGSGYYILEAPRSYRYFQTLEQVKRYIDCYNGYMEARVD